MAAIVLSRAGKAYVWAVVAAGGGLIGYSVVQLTVGPPPHYWLLLAALTLFSGPFSIRVPSIRTSVSVSETFVLASVLLFGPAPAALTVALDGLLVSLWAQHRSVYRALFNIAEPAISVWVSAQLFYALAGVEPLWGQPVGIGQLWLPLLVLTTSYFLLNGWLQATAVWFETQVSPQRYFRNQLSQLSLNYFASVCLVVLLVLNADNLSFVAIGVFIPLLVMSYASSKTSMARVEETNCHLAEVNKLYLSTVEALAMAIDAKDQITHGHIRRVQIQTVALAKSLGVKNATQIKAIEVAALLHDLGKLAVPEHVLNKPDALTPVEFDQMKTHASVGANILSTIEFPYPVTPIIRYHHESWDGSGYPDGLKGEEIPIGARILAVVDCFDALTSDRPYRRRLSSQEALDILRSRRGTMYDPIVVDRFVEIYGTLPPDSSYSAKAALVDVVSPLMSLAERSPATHSAPSSGDHPPTQLETESGERMPRSDGEQYVTATVRALARYLTTVAPDTVCVLYTYEAATGELVASYVSSVAHSFLHNVTVPLGERLTGWVGANRQTIVNSDAGLDLGDLVGAREPRLRRCLSTPLVRRGTLLGVLTVYSSNPAGFNGQQARIAELLAREGVGPEHDPQWEPSHRLGLDQADRTRPVLAEQQRRADGGRRVAQLASVRSWAPEATSGPAGVPRSTSGEVASMVAHVPEGKAGA